MSSINSLLVTIGTFLVFFLPMVICFILGYKRGMFNSALRLGCSLVSAVAAFVAARMLGPTLSTIWENRLPFLSLPYPVRTLLLQSGLSARLISGVITPFVFCGLYFLFDKFSLLAYFPLKKQFAYNESYHNVKNDNLYGALLGAVLSLTISITCLMPVCGYLSYLPHLEDELSVTLTSGQLSDNSISAVEDNAELPSMTVGNALSGWLFRGLTVDAAKAVNDAKPLLSAIKSINEMDKAEEIEGILNEACSGNISYAAAILHSSLVLPEEPLRQIINPFGQMYFDALSKAPSLSKEEYDREIQICANTALLAKSKKNATVENTIKALFPSPYFTAAVIDYPYYYEDYLYGNISEKEKSSINKFLNKQEKNNPDAVQAIRHILGD